MADNQSEQSPVNPETPASSSQKGLSKEAWTAVSAIAVALISGIFAIITTLIPILHPAGQPSSSPMATAGKPERSPSTEPSASQTLPSLPSLSPASSAQSSPPSTPQILLSALETTNIDYSVSEAQILSWLGNPDTEYPQIAQACLTLLPHAKLKHKVALDVIVYDYKQISGLPVDQRLPPHHIVNLEKLKQAIAIGYNERYNPSTQSFAEIVESR